MPDLQCGDGLVLVHQVRHDSVQGALPLAGGARAGAGVRPELTQLFVLCLVGVRQCDFTSRRGILAGEEDRVGHLLHGQVPDGAQGASAGGAAGELGPAVGAYLGKDGGQRVGFFPPQRCSSLRGGGRFLKCHQVTKCSTFVYSLSFSVF